MLVRIKIIIRSKEIVMCFMISGQFVRIIRKGRRSECDKGSIPISAGRRLLMLVSTIARESRRASIHRQHTKYSLRTGFSWLHEKTRKKEKEIASFTRICKCTYILTMRTNLLDKFHEDTKEERA